MLVHLDDDSVLLAYSYIPVQVPVDVIIKVDDFATLPVDWSISPPPLAMQKIGDEWIKKGVSAVLEVPTSIIPLERNYLLNPLHADFARIDIGGIERFTFDERLTGK